MTAITTRIEPCWTLVHADGSPVSDIVPHYDTEADAVKAAGTFLLDPDQTLSPKLLDGLCSTAVLACGYRYDESNECVEHWPSADQLRDHLLKLGYRLGPDGSLRCPADMGCDECDAMPGAPDYTPLPGQLDLLGGEVRG
jgi:hypothetical protein